MNKSIKADDYVEYEDKTKSKWTNFEELVAMVEELKNTINEHAEILRANDITRKEEIEAPFVDEDSVFKKLEEEDE